uniref:Ubiquitin thioesterase n=1 Tax=Clastoptera arizonana TaxID=38151 RepID=A0A1B6DY32_9HEMI
MDNDLTETVGYDPNVNQDDLIIQQSRDIEKEISESIALVGKKECLTKLECEYICDEIYLQKVRDLSNKYSSVRKIRPDGNCFFRAFAYAYFERLLGNKDEYQRFHELALKSKDKLIALGFPQFTLEDFHDTFMEIVDLLAKGVPAENELHKLFNDQGYSDYAVVYLRLITSGRIQEDADFYRCFIEGDRSISDFCHQEVEPMFKESDHIHIIALSSALNIGVRVRYMDRGEGSQVIAHDFPEGVTPAIHLLYRPGHYDILYPISAC